MLDDGTYMLANCCAFSPPLAALFNATPPFTSANWASTGSGKANGSYNEEGWTVLPSGNVLTVDVDGFQGQNSEIYSATLGTWSSGGLTGAVLTTCNPNNPLSACEMGPQVLRPDVAPAVTVAGPSSAIPANGDNVLVLGGVNEGTDPTVIYNRTRWTVWSGRGRRNPAFARIKACAGRAAEVAVSRRMLAEIPPLIPRLRAPPAPA